LMRGYLPARPWNRFERHNRRANGEYQAAGSSSQSGLALPEQYPVTYRAARTVEKRQRWNED
jgi:hypothetical protein